MAYYPQYYPQQPYPYQPPMMDNLAQLRPGLGAVGTQGVVVLQRTVLVAYRGSQAHDALQQPNLIIRILGHLATQGLRNMGLSDHIGKNLGPPLPIKRLIHGVPSPETK